MPVNDLREVKRLILNVKTREFFQVVQNELLRHSLDEDDLVSIVVDELGTIHCFKSKTTKKYYPGTTSDYFSIWIDVCQCRMFIKLLIAKDNMGERVVVTSFKRDDRHV